MCAPHCLHNHKHPYQRTWIGNTLAGMHAIGTGLHVRMSHIHTFLELQQQFNWVSIDLGVCVV